MKVRVGSFYYYSPNLLDRCDGRTDLVEGDFVKVVNLPGCPKANTMGHCYVEKQGRFAGMVHTNSLHTRADYIAYIKAAIAKCEAKEAL
jgi:hypothetical protein